MEESYFYNGYNITYKTLGGTTIVSDCGFEVVRFEGQGKIKGDELAKDYIHDLLIDLSHSDYV